MPEVAKIKIKKKHKKKALIQKQTKTLIKKTLQNVRAGSSEIRPCLESVKNGLSWVKGSLADTDTLINEEVGLEKTTVGRCVVLTWVPL